MASTPIQCVSVHESINRLAMHELAEKKITRIQYTHDQVLCHVCQANVVKFFLF